MLSTNIELNGQTLKLEYDWDCQIKAEKMTGVNILIPERYTSSELLRAHFLARLLKHQPNVSVSDVNNLLPTNLDVISNAMNSIGENQDSEDGDVENVEKTKD